MQRLLLIVSVLLMASGSTQAQEGDIEAGKASAQLCAGCHGADGNSPAAQFPNLAGQVPGYIAKQLAKFKAGTDRIDPIMLGMATSSEANWQNLDAFYAAQSAKAGSISEEQLADAEFGEQIYRGGFKPMKISACMSCHGPSGHGIPPNFPRLSGQHADYIEKQLLAFKDGSRKDTMMNPISFSLTAQQIKQLALYISALY